MYVTYLPRYAQVNKYGIATLSAIFIPLYIYFSYNIYPLLTEEDCIQKML